MNRRKELIKALEDTATKGVSVWGGLMMQAVEMLKMDEGVKQPYDYEVSSALLCGRAISEDKLRAFIGQTRDTKETAQSMWNIATEAQRELAAREAEIKLLKESLLSAELALGQRDYLLQQLKDTVEALDGTSVENEAIVDLYRSLFKELNHG